MRALLGLALPLFGLADGSQDAPGLAVLMWAFCAGPEAAASPDRRYGAGVAAALWFLLLGAGGVTTGLAMTPALVAALTDALAVPDERTGAVVALLLTTAGVRLLGIGAPFWGLLFGTLASRALCRSTRSTIT